MTVQRADTIPMVISLPFELLERTERLVERGLADNRDSLLRIAIEKFIDELEVRSSIDAELAAMADDEDFQALNRQVAAEFAASDYEALRVDENETR